MEKIDVIDTNGSLTGAVKTRKEVHKKGLLHHASGVIIIRNNGGGGMRYFPNNAH